MTATLLALVLLGMAAVPSVLFLVNLRRYRRAPPPSARPQGAGLSVVIPARNEERAIGPALDAVLASTDTDMEVIVVDDASEDRTAAVVRDRMGRDPRVRLVPSPGLPPGWNGKQHSCHVGARAATRPYLLFLDADVRLEPQAPSRLLAFQARSGASLVSGAPRQVTGTWLEHLVVPLIHFVLLGFLPMGLMRRSRHPAFAAGIGQLFLARRDHYLAAGGHAAIRSTRHDGLALPAAFRRAGFATDLVDATDLATCRMYEGAAQVWSGFLKNAHEGLGKGTLIGPASLLLVGGQVAPFALLPFLALLPPPLQAAALLSSGLVLLTRLQAALRFRQSGFGALFHPVGVLLLVAIQYHSLLRRWMGTTTPWKGRAGLAAAAVLLGLGLLEPETARAVGPEPTASQRQVLSEGKVILTFARSATDASSGTFTGFVLLDARPDQVWAVVLDFERLARRSGVVADVSRYNDFVGSDGRRTVDLAYRLEILGQDIGYHIHHVFDPAAERLVWELDPSRENDIRALEGSFSVRATPGSPQTLLVYQSHVTTGRFIPDWVEVKLREEALRRFLAGVREEVEEG